MDPNNPVIRLCAQGMQCEGKGLHGKASQLFLTAWDQSSNDFERCIAAHYVARHQETPEDALTWNQRSLDLADATGGEPVRGFYPSLYLNLGKAHEDLGNHADAERYYRMAAGVLDSLSEGRYGDIVRDGVSRALARVRGTQK